MAQVEVIMPKMGESIMEGTVIEWHKEIGERVEQDETLLEIATDKVDSEIPAPEAGYLKEVLVPEGETVEVGTPIAILVETEEELEGQAAEPTPAPDQTEAAEEEETPTETAAQSESAPAPASAPAAVDESAPDAGSQGDRSSSGGSDGGSEVEVVMPKMGESIVEGTVIEWFKQPGDPVEEDETLLEIATDKVDTEIPSPSKGTLKEIRAEEGATVEVGQTLAIIATGVSVEGDAAPSPSAEEREEVAEPVETGAQTDSSDREAVQPAPSGDGAATTEDREIPRRSPTGQFFSPLVRSIAEKEGLTVDELESVEGSGAGGRVTKEDVMAYLDQKKQQRDRPASQPQARQETRTQERKRPEPRPTQAAEEYGDRVEVVEMDRMRQVIAEHMVHSKQTAAHVTSFTEADVTNLVHLRDNNKESFYEREGVRLSYTPFFAEAAIEALRDHPWLNASVEGDRIIVKKEYHMGIAVAVGGAGLLVPVVRNAGQKNLVGLNRDIADLARRARNRQLQPDELQGGTFTVTNIGSLGSMMGTPIINQPQVAILGPGAIKKRPVVIEHPDQGDTIGIRHMMYLSLSYDHRIIDGAMAASFLQDVVENLEAYDPNMTL